MPTLFTDPRSGGVKKSSGVNVLPIVAETWAQVRNNASNEMTYLIASYVPNSKTDIHVIQKGSGGIQGCCQNLPNDQPLFGGVRLCSGRFVSFVYNRNGVSVMLKGRASMHKNGVLNVLEGCDMEVEVWEGMLEEDVGKSRDEASLGVQSSTMDEIQMDNEYQEEVRDYIVKEEASQTPTTSTLPSESIEAKDEVSLDATDSKSVPYSKLKDMMNPERHGIDPSKKEMALSDSEFLQVFKMDKESFAKLAGWKQSRMKKDASLF